MARAGQASWQAVVTSPSRMERSSRSEAMYVYATTARRAVVAQPKGEEESNDALRFVLVAVLGVASVGALVVLWANS